MTGNRTKFPHLTGCMESLTTENGKGLCFHRSAALCLDLPGSEVVMATFRAASEEEQKAIPNASTEPFIHCFVEYDGRVFAPSLIERMGNRLVPQDRDKYYAINGARDFYRITRPALLKLATGTGLSAHLRYGLKMKDGWTVGKLLLEGAGVRYRLTEFGSVVPE